MTLSRFELLRIGAGLAGIVLTATSEGDAIVLAVLLAVAAWRPAVALAVPIALGATSWRWGSTSLDAWAGGQAVLGPAGWLEPTRVAVAAWMAGASLVLSAPVPGWRTVTTELVDGGRVAMAERPSRSLATTLTAVALGLAAGVAVAGPSWGERWWVRPAGALAGLAVAVGVQRLRRHRDRPVDGAAIVAGVAALVAVVPVAPGWSGTVDLGAAGRGALVATAIAATSVVGSRALAAMGLLPRRRLQSRG